MSETKNHHEPVNGPTQLVPAALSAFRALLWIGLTLAGVGLVVGIIGISNDGYGEELARAGAFAFSGGMLQWATPFLVGAGIIAGLGKREPFKANAAAPPAAAPGANAPATTTPPSSTAGGHGVYVPAAE